MGCCLVVEVVEGLGAHWLAPTLQVVILILVQVLQPAPRVLAVMQQWQQLCLVMVQQPKPPLQPCLLLVHQQPCQKRVHQQHL